MATGQVDSYLTLVQNAFVPAYWSSEQLVDATGSPAAIAEFTVVQYNFSLFWGLSIQAYEATLIADDSRVDQFFDGNTAALTADEQTGLRLFRGRQTDCTNCHAGAELTLASFTGAGQNQGRNGRVNDPGFFRTGVRPITEDAGLGGVDSFDRSVPESAERRSRAL